MREIVPTEALASLARELGAAAVCDARLYENVVKTHCWDAFDAFSSKQRGEHVSSQAEAPSADFDPHLYVRQMTERRELLNAFIRIKPHVVVTDDRFFSITFLSEVEVRVHELTVNEVAAAVNECMRPRGFVTMIRDWLETRRR